MPPVILTDPRCREHVAPPGYPECVERLTAVLEGIEAAGLAIRSGCDERAATEEALERVHGGAYLERFERAVARGDALFDSADNPLSPGTGTAARAAAETAVAAARSVAEGGAGRAFAVVRPPGHHAERETAMGFCYLNNVAVAAEHLIAAHGVELLAICDLDVHHGNGTQQIFYERGDVLYSSLHQYPFYPGTGAREERGEGAGEGTTVNVPLPAGSGDATWESAVRTEVLPALTRFRPQLLLVSLGLDAWRDDLLGGMQVSGSGFRRLGSLLGAWADRDAGGRVVVVLEGGYDLRSLGRLSVEFLAGLDGLG